VLAERLKRPKIPQLTEPHWVQKEWDDIMSFMLCGQHLLLPVVPGQFEDPPIAKRPKGQDRRDPPKMPTKQRSTPEVSTGSQTVILPEDDIVERTSDTGNANNGEDKEDQTPSLGRIQQQVEEMRMDTIVALAVEALAADGRSTVTEAYAKQRRSSRRSRIGQIVVRHQNNSNGKRRQEL